MKTSALALTLGMAATLAGTGAFAATSTGQINFTGNVNANTCPVIPVIPGAPGTGSIPLGDVSIIDFGGAADTEAGGREFALLIEDGTVCGFAAGDTATVELTSSHGSAGTDGKYYGIQTGGAQGVALAIKHQDGTHIDHGTPSKPFTLNPTGETRMMFEAKYRSTAAVVTQGPVIANVNFLVTLP